MVTTDGTRKFLILEDDPDIQMLIAHYLNSRWPGAIVDKALNGIEGIDEQQLRQYDVMFTDINMPGMDGRGFIQTIKENYWLNESTPIIVITKVELKPLREELKQFHNIKFLRKPFTRDAFIELVRKA